VVVKKKYGERFDLADAETSTFPEKTTKRHSRYTNELGL
jgi:hypothetical protein